MDEDWGELIAVMGGFVCDVTLATSPWGVTDFALDVAGMDSVDAF